MRVNEAAGCSAIRRRLGELSLRSPDDRELDLDLVRPARHQLPTRWKALPPADDETFWKHQRVAGARDEEESPNA